MSKKESLEMLLQQRTCTDCGGRALLHVAEPRCDVWASGSIRVCTRERLDVRRWRGRDSRGRPDKQTPIPGTHLLHSPTNIFTISMILRGDHLGRHRSWSCLLRGTPRELTATRRPPQGSTIRSETIPRTTRHHAYRRHQMAPKAVTTRHAAGTRHDPGQTLRLFLSLLATTRCLSQMDEVYD